MNVADDAFAKLRRDRNFERLARSELGLLDRINDGMVADRDRCEASLMLMSGVELDEIYAFIARKESTQRRAGQQVQ